MIKIFTDSGADFPYDLESEKSLYNIDDVGMLPMYYSLTDENGITQEYSVDKNLSMKEFYDSMRNGARPKTSAISWGLTRDLFLEELKKGNDILSISLSSGITSSCGIQQKVADELMNEDEYKEYSNGRKIRVIDSKIGSLPQALLVNTAVEMSKNGYSVDEIVQYLEDNKMLYNVDLALDTLEYLVAGGRISPIVGKVGNAVGVKPLISVDSNGEVFQASKFRGSRRILDKLIEKMQSVGLDNITELGVMHCGNEEMAMEMIDKLSKLDIVDKKDIKSSYLCPNIVCHTGPETFVLGYKTKKLVRTLRK